MIIRKATVIGAVAIAAITGAATSAWAGGPAATTQPSAALDVSVPPALIPPAGNTLASSFAAAGVQVYQCTAGTWAFVEPAASLVGSTTTISLQTAIHFRGPSWESTSDGSLVTAAAIASSPVSGSIPQLLLRASSNRGDGVFGDVTFIQRLHTRGGVAPAGTCADGQTTGVAYTALYRFFVAG